MGWFWNSKGSDGNAYDTLDPKLKDYLDKESPLSRPSSQPPTKPPLTTPPPPPSSQQSPAQPAPSTVPASTSSTTPPVPKESLYQDGRYAHLWKTYPSSSPSTLSPSGTSPGTPSNSQDQLTSLLTTYQTRRAEISRAALANCVEEHMAENACFSSGSLAKKLGACREESRAFSRCYTLQARFLRAMGYMDVALDGMEAAEAERVREGMLGRADEIWTEVRRREVEVERARREGRGEPVFGELGEFRRGREVGGARAGAVVGGGERAAPGVVGAREELPWEEREKEMLKKFKPERREVLEDILKGKSRTEREMELKLQIAEAESTVGYGEKVGEYFKQEVEDRRKRKEEGKSTLGDYLKWLGGWSQ